MSEASLLVPQKNKEPAAVVEGEDLARTLAAPNSLFEARVAAVRAAANPLLEASGPLLKALADIPSCDRLERADAFNDLLTREIREFQKTCELAEIKREHIVTARYCLCTALDEAVSKTSWGDLLTGQSMLVLFHNETYGGEKFFLLLGRMSLEASEHLDVLELLYHILSLGFEGRYALAPDGRRQLENIQQKLLAELSSAGRTTDNVLSDPHSVPGKPLPPLRIVPVWLTAALVLIALLAAHRHFYSGLDEKSEKAHTAALALLKESPARKGSCPPETLNASLVLKWFSSEDKVRVSETPTSIVVSIPGAALFTSGAFSLDSSIFPLLDKIGANLKTLNRNVLIVGHTDNVPVRKGATNFLSNKELSEKRAQAFMEYFNKHSLTSRMRAVGKGEDEPLASNGSAAGRSQNRRVDMHIAKRADQDIFTKEAAASPAKQR